MMKAKLVKGGALMLDVGAPLVATFTQFPVWVERSAEATVSGLFLVFAILCSIPIFKSFKSLLKSPSAPLMWGIVLAVLVSLRNIVDEMIVISFVGLIANGVGWGLYKVGDGLEAKNKVKEST